MVTSNLPPRRSSDNPVIVTDVECDTIRVIPHLVLNAIEIVVLNPTGDGYRTWIGGDIASDFAFRVSIAAADLLRGASP